MRNVLDLGARFHSNGQKYLHLLLYAIIAIFLVTTLSAFSAAQDRQFYVAPNGSPNGDGSRDRPWDLATALSSSRVPPGSTIWLRGGTYKGFYTSTLTGTESSPITVRGMQGERAIIVDDRARAGGGTLLIRGAWTIYRDLEVTNTNLDRSASRTYRPMGFHVFAPHTKFINLVIHDTGHGIGVWREAVDAEVYGNIIYNCGTQNELIDQGHGHGIYSQNDTGTKIIRDNVVLNQFGWGLHIWPGPGHVSGFLVEGNVFANNGALSSPSHFDDNLLINGHAPYRMERISVISNYTYDFPRTTPGAKFYDAGVCLICTDSRPRAGEDVLVRDNYFVGGGPVAIFGAWMQMTVTENTFAGDLGFVSFAGLKRPGLRRMVWDDNQYFGRELDAPDGRRISFLLDKSLMPFNEWSQATGFDRRSQYVPNLPTGVKVFIRPNRYEQGRANIIVYNWDRKDRVEVDLSSVLRGGSQYEVRNAQDYLSSPVLSGTFDGRPVVLPMRGLSVATPVGRPAPRSMAPEFAVFIVRTADGQTARSSEPFTRPQPTPSTERASMPLNDDLRRYSGLFATRGPVARMLVELKSGGLVATMLDEPRRPTYKLLPVSSGRFRIIGGPVESFVQYHFSGTQVTSLTVERGRLPSVTLFLQP